MRGCTGKQRLPEELRAALRAIQRQGEKMAGLLSQLLLLARADNGSQKLRREPVDLSEMAAAVAEDSGSWPPKSGSP